MKKKKWLAVLGLSLFMMTSCSQSDKMEDVNSTTTEATGQSENADSDNTKDVDEEGASSEQMGATEMEETDMSEQTKAIFENVKANLQYKGINDTNPLMTQRFGADPYALIYNDRVYFYMTADAFEYDDKGELIDNTYSKIKSINVISTDDMINFTDHGAIMIGKPDGAAKWANNSWAPAAAWKEIDGKPKFFLYFADAGGGIGVLQADSPVGPFTDPLGKGLITRDTPTCAEVTWLFDPAVLVDDDGEAYIYFGGGIPQGEGKIANPGTGRVAKLGADMISIVGDPVPLDVPYLFEDSGIHKFNNKYYYTYCSNWQVDEEGTKKYGFVNAEIVMLESDNPMGPFKFKEKILENPGRYCGLYGNNHHAVFNFKDQWYITYHTRLLEKKMGLQKGYRATHVDPFEIAEDGTIGVIKQTTTGRTQVKYVNPFEEHNATTMAVMGGLDTVPAKDGAAGEMILTDINTGDFLKVQGVDFGSKAPKKWIATIKAEGNTDNCAIEICADKLGADVIGYLKVDASGDFAEMTAEIEKELTGVHDIYLIFAGEGYEMKSWRFE